METKIIQEDPWDKLRSFSKARIALGHVGGSLPLREVLDFKLAHANAKDAINSELEVEKIMAQLAVFQLPIFQVKSQIENRNQYLKRPDLGRKLNKESAQLLKVEQQKFDIVFILADGLSAEAINSHAVEVLNQTLPELAAKYKIGIVVATQARVALGDDIGELFKRQIHRHIYRRKARTFFAKKYGNLHHVSSKNGLNG